MPAADSPNGKNLLLVSGSTSGTVSVVQLNARGKEFGAFISDIGNNPDVLLALKKKTKQIREILVLSH